MTPGSLHLVISHKKRRALNAQLQEKFAEGKHVITIPAYEGEPEYACTQGTPLVGSCTGRGFVNGAFYEVQEICNGIKVVDKLTGEGIECSAEVLAKHTCLAHAVVYNRAQHPHHRRDFGPLASYRSNL